MHAVTHRAPFIASVILVSASSIAAAESPAPVHEVAQPDKRLGVGYKAGNGIGFLGGDVIINVVPHVTIDLHGSYLSTSTSFGESASVYSFAPALQAYLFAGQRSTPYAAIGMQYAHFTVGDATASGVGGFVNIGYEFKWQSGLGIQLGGGVQYFQETEATSGSTTLMKGGKAAPNIEIGLRYLFL